MIAQGANSRFYLTGAGKTPIWEIFSRESVRDLTVQVGNPLLLSRVIARFTRAHRAILSNNASNWSSDPEFQLSYCCFVPIFLARIIMYKLQMFSVLHEMNGIIPFGGNMAFFSLMGPPAYYASIGLGPWGGTLSKSAPRQVTLICLGRACYQSDL
jgi:hypothetical protein